MASYKLLDDGRYLIRAELKNRNGKRVRRYMHYSPTARTPAKIRAELQRVSNQFQERCQHENAAEDCDLSFADAVKMWREDWASARLSPPVLEMYERCFAEYCEDLMRVPLSRLSVLHLQEVADAMQKGHSPVTAKRYFDSVRSVIRYCYRLGLIDRNDTDRVVFLANEDEGKLRFWTAEQLSRFVAFLKDPASDISHKWRLFFLFACYSGARRAEILALQWHDFNLKNGTVTIERSAVLDHHQQKTKRPKTAAGIRTFTLPDDFFEVLARYKLFQMRHHCSVSPSSWVFQKEDGSMIYLTSPSKKFISLVKQCNTSLPVEDRLPPISIHGLRHSAASLMVSSGVDVLTVAHRLGHSRISHTLDIYSHADPEKDRKASTIFSLLGKGSDK